MLVFTEQAGSRAGIVMWLLLLGTSGLSNLKLLLLFQDTSTPVSF
jgi:hypothetical protein